MDGAYIGMRQNENARPAVVYDWIDGTRGVDLPWEPPDEPDWVDISLWVRIHTNFVKTTPCSTPYGYICMR